MPYCKCINDTWGSMWKYKYINAGSIYEFNVEIDEIDEIDVENSIEWKLYCVKSSFGHGTMMQKHDTMMQEYEFKQNFRIIHRKEKLERILKCI